MKTVQKSKAMLGLFFIAWQMVTLVSLSFGFISQVHANVITAHGIDQGDQSQTEELFHQGLQAYLEGDFQQAYTQWSKAEESDHPKATFNIGRMWFQGRVPGQSQDKEQARQFFQKAADLGYAVATKYLEQPTERFSEDQIVSSSSASAAPDVKKQTEPVTTIVNTSNDWLKKYPNGAWVIQIFASQEAILLKQMIRDYSLKDKAKILTEKIDGALWYKLIYGQYTTKQKALDARQSLPELLRKEKPWVRAVSAIRKSQKL